MPPRFGQGLGLNAPDVAGRTPDDEQKQKLGLRLGAWLRASPQDAPAAVKAQQAPPNLSVAKERAVPVHQAKEHAAPARVAAQQTSADVEAPRKVMPKPAAVAKNAADPVVFEPRKLVPKIAPPARVGTESDVKAKCDDAASGSRSTDSCRWCQKGECWDHQAVPKPQVPREQKPLGPTAAGEEAGRLLAAKLAARAATPPPAKPGTKAPASTPAVPFRPSLVAQPKPKPAPASGTAHIPAATEEEEEALNEEDELNEQPEDQATLTVLKARAKPSSSVGPPPKATIILQSRAKAPPGARHISGDSEVQSFEDPPPEEAEEDDGELEAELDEDEEESEEPDDRPRRRVASSTWTGPIKAGVSSVKRHGQQSGLTRPFSNRTAPQSVKRPAPPSWGRNAGAIGKKRLR